MAAGKRKQLGTESKAVLALLPPTSDTPDFAGAYVGEIAEDLLGRTDSIARARIRGLVHEIDSKLGRLCRHKHRGETVYGQTMSYSIPARLWPKAQKALRRGYALDLRP